MVYIAANSSRTLLLSLTTQRQRAAFSLFQHPLLLHPHPLNNHPRLYSSSRNVVQILEERGLLDSLTSDLLRQPDHPPLRVYCGFDPTAESLHLGNLLGIIVLSWFLHCSHRVVALVGGATGRVGDPSGKSSERPELDPVFLDRNISAISSTIRTILGQEASLASSSVTILNNYDWWKDVKLVDFLRDVGEFVRVGPMMSKESVRKRLELEQGMSYTEFTYQLLQIEDEIRAPGYVPNSAQRRLTEEVTRFVHGEEGLNEALKATRALRPDAETKLDWKSKKSIAEDVPSFSLSRDEVLNRSLLDLSACTGLLESKSATRLTDETRGTLFEQQQN